MKLETPSELLRLLGHQHGMIIGLEENVAERRRQRSRLLLDGWRMGISTAKLAEVLAVDEADVVRWVREAADSVTHAR